MKKYKNLIIALLPLVLSIVVLVLLFILMPSTNLAWWKKLLTLVISLIVSLFFSVFFHEFGHMLYGLFTGYKFLQFRLAHLVIYKNKHIKIKFEKLQPGLLGQCMMIPPKKKKGKQTKFALYNAGGLIHSYLLLIVSIILFIFINNGILRCALIPLIVIDFYFCLSNSIYIEDGINDVCNYIKIKKEPRKLDSLLYQLEVSANLFRDKNYGAKVSYPLYISTNLDNITFPPVLFRFYYAMDHNDLNLAKKYISIIEDKYYSISYLPHKIIAILELLYSDLVIFNDEKKFKRHYNRINEAMLVLINRFQADLKLYYQLYNAIAEADYDKALAYIDEINKLDSFKGDKLSTAHRMSYLSSYINQKKTL